MLTRSCWYHRTPVPEARPLADVSLAEALKETGRTVGRSRGGISLSNALLVGQVAFSFLLLVTAVFCLLAIAVVALRRSAFGRRLVALRDSEAAAVTVGVNILETKLVVFALSAAMAAFAGAFYAQQARTLSQ